MTIQKHNESKLTFNTFRWISNDIKLGRYEDAEKVARQFAGILKKLGEQHKAEQEAAMKHDSRHELKSIRFDTAKNRA